MLLVKKLVGLGKMMAGVVNASFSLPEWPAIKMIFFAPCHHISYHIASVHIDILVLEVCRMFATWT